MEVKLNNKEEVYKCVLCNTDSDLNGIVGHLLSTCHRLAFLRKHFPTVARKFTTSIPENQWPLASYDLLDTVAGRIEARCGRGQVTTVGGLLAWERERMTLVQKITEAVHARLESHFFYFHLLVMIISYCRESADFNFEKLPDPFR